jgi:hypothetical protein
MASSSSSRSKSGFYKVLVGVHKFVIDKRYQQLKLIGDGSYGLVASAVDVKTGNIPAFISHENEEFIAIEAFM